MGSKKNKKEEQEVEERGPEAIGGWAVIKGVKRGERNKGERGSELSAEVKEARQEN